jgi:hypothetical protein
MAGRGELTEAAYSDIAAVVAPQWRATGRPMAGPACSLGEQRSGSSRDR